MANITRYTPFNELVTLRNAMDRLFEDSVLTPRSFNTSNRITPANIYETTEEFTLQIPMPGVNPDDVEINVQQDTVSLKWRSNVEIPEGATVHHHGFRNSEYQQSFTVTTPISAEKADASYRNGILILRLPKAEHARPRTIKVSATK